MRDKTITELLEDARTRAAEPTSVQDAPPTSVQEHAGETVLAHKRKLPRRSSRAAVEVGMNGDAQVAISSLLGQQDETQKRRQRRIKSAPLLTSQAKAKSERRREKSCASTTKQKRLKVPGRTYNPIAPGEGFLIRDIVRFTGFKLSVITSHARKCGVLKYISPGEHGILTREEAKILLRELRLNSRLY